MRDEYVLGVDYLRNGKYKKALKYLYVGATKRGPWGEGGRNENISNNTLGLAQFFW